MAQMLRIMQLLSRVEEGENLGRCPARSASSGEPRCCLQPAPCSPRPVSVSLQLPELCPRTEQGFGRRLSGCGGEVSLWVRGGCSYLSHWGGAKNSIRGVPGLVCWTNTSAW